jgi:tetratricopeptide (TPR) repeat protein
MQHVVQCTRFFSEDGALCNEPDLRDRLRAGFKAFFKVGISARHVRDVDDNGWNAFLTQIICAALEPYFSGLAPLDMYHHCHRIMPHLENFPRLLNGDRRGLLHIFEAQARVLQKTRNTVTVHTLFDRLLKIFPLCETQEPLTHARVAEAHGLAFIREADAKKRPALYRKAMEVLREALATLMRCLASSSDAKDQVFLTELVSITSSHAFLDEQVRPFLKKQESKPCDRFRMQRVLRYLGSALGASGKLDLVETGLKLLISAQGLVAEGIETGRFHPIYEAKVSSYLGKVYMYQALILKQQNAGAETALSRAREYLDRAVAVDLHHLGPHHALLSGAHYYLGRVLCELGHLDEGVAKLDHALKLIQASYSNKERHEKFFQAYLAWSVKRLERM